jgi:hypothetical protein
LTVPSAVAAYYLTGTIYLVDGSGVFRYQNRERDTDMTTADHRLELLAAGDARNILKSAAGLPPAPAYIVICVKSAVAGSVQAARWAVMEAGFAGAGMLLQSSALGLACHFKTRFTTVNEAAVQKAIKIPTADIPKAIVSLGHSSM